MNDLRAAVAAAAAREVPRAALAAAVATRLEALGAPAASVEAARRLALPRSVVLVAGQQPVLLGGPGLVWAKAADALALARRIEREEGVPAVAVFWNASEDHDHAECDHVTVDLGAEPETLRAPLPGDRRMLSRVEVPEAARTLAADVASRLPEGASRDAVAASIAPAADDTMGSWFSRILVRRLGGEGLVVVEPETLRAFAAGVVRHDVARPGELAAAIRGAAPAGARPALDLARDELFFLVDDAGRRVRVTRDGGAWRSDDGRTLTTDELLALPPSAFSWNVAARVFAQDTALPVAAQICGPSEIRYCAELAPAHALLGIPAPLLVRRSEWVFVTARAARFARDLAADPLRLAAGDVPGAPAWSEPRELAQLREIVARLPSQGSAAVQRRHAGLVQGVEGYAEALARDAAERGSVGAERLRKALAILRPAGAGQDRAFSPLPYVARLGDAAVARAISQSGAGAQIVFSMTDTTGAGA